MPRPPEPTPLLSRLATLNDMARLRMMRLLERSELSVGELARALQLPQSTVSRHLKLLHEGAWIVKRTSGTASLYRLSETALDDEASALWTLARAQMGETATFAEDDARLEEVLAERRVDSKAFFGQIGGEWNDKRRELFGEGGTCEALLALLSPDWVVADLGCGTGDAAEQLGPYVKQVIAIDREPSMLKAAQRRLAEFDNIDFREGDLESLPLEDREVDAALVFLVLHHVSEPARAVREIARTLRPGGVALIVDMVSHDREAYRHTMGHRHLGFSEEDVTAWAKSAKLRGVRYHRLHPDTAGKGPPLFVATMRKGA